MAYSEEYKAKALELFYSLGDDRTLPMLQEKLREKCSSAPGMRTLSNWHKDGDWASYIKGLVAPRLEGAQAKALEKIAVDNFVAKSELRAFGGYLVRKAFNELEKEDLSVLDKERMGAIHLLTQDAIALVKAAAVEEGGVSDRVAEETTMHVDDKRAEAEEFVDFIMKTKRSNEEKMVH